MAETRRTLSKDAALPVRNTELTVDSAKKLAESVSKIESEALLNTCKVFPAVGKLWCREELKFISPRIVDLRSLLVLFSHLWLKDNLDD